MSNPALPQLRRKSAVDGLPNGPFLPQRMSLIPFKSSVRKKNDQRYWVCRNVFFRELKLLRSYTEMAQRKRKRDHLSEDEPQPQDESPFNLLPVEITGVILFFATGVTPVLSRLSTTLSVGELAMCFLCRFVCRQWRNLLPLPPLPTTGERRDLIQKSKQRSSAVCDWAASRGDLKMLMWARENGCPWFEQTFTKGTAPGDLALLTWAKENGCPSEHGWLDMATLRC